MYTTHITVKDIASGYIATKYGWAVAEQFENIYDDLSAENITKQNFTSLGYIRDSLTNLIKSGTLSEGSKDELLDRLVNLVEHIQWNS